jgi:hypothetical protein
MAAQVLHAFARFDDATCVACFALLVTLAVLVLA